LRSRILFFVLNRTKTRCWFILY